jgi:hypothetical protein
MRDVICDSPDACGQKLLVMGLPLHCRGLSCGILYEPPRDDLDRPG